jgi:hypothetical protein
MADSADIQDRIRRGGWPIEHATLFSKLTPVMVVDNVEEWYLNNSTRIIPWMAAVSVACTAEFGMVQIFGTANTGYDVLVQEFWGSMASAGRTQNVWLETPISGGSVDGNGQVLYRDTRLADFTPANPIIQQGANAGSVIGGGAVNPTFPTHGNGMGKISIDVVLQPGTALVIETNVAVTDTMRVGMQGLLVPQRR